MAKKDFDFGPATTQFMTPPKEPEIPEPGPKAQPEPKQVSGAEPEQNHEPRPELKQVLHHKEETGLKELKRKRLNLLIQPSLYEDLAKIAWVKKISVNEAISRAAGEFRDKEKRALEKYHDICGE